MNRKSRSNLILITSSKLSKKLNNFSRSTRLFRLENKNKNRLS